jgi:hypothetical protein
MKTNANGELIHDVEMDGRKTTITFGHNVKALCGAVLTRMTLEACDGDQQLAFALVNSAIGKSMVPDAARKACSMVVTLKLSPGCPYPDDDESIARDILEEMGMGTDGRPTTEGKIPCAYCGKIH